MLFGLKNKMCQHTTSEMVLSFIIAQIRRIFYNLNAQAPSDIERLPGVGNIGSHSFYL